MKIFGLTALGKKAAKRGEGPSDEVKVLQYMRENKAVTDSELEVIGGTSVVRSLQRQGLVEELTK
jgi:dihydrofolate reductase